MSRLRRVWSDFYKKSMEKGHERLTIMIIPHGEAHIFNLQISKITIVFAILITAAIISASILSTRFQADIRDEVETLQDSNRAVYHEREQYIQKFMELSEKQRYLREKVLALFVLSGMSEKTEYLFLTDEQLRDKAAEMMRTESDVFITKLKELRRQKEEGKSILPALQTRLMTAAEESGISDKFEFHPEVVAYKELQMELADTIRGLRVFQSFLTERETVHLSLPYYWPLEGGHFTSFYGLRADPTGSGGEFHTGVDLAKSPGSPIYSTAEGIVRSAGNSGGYGLSVRVQHKFGYETVYAHMSSIHVYVGQKIRRGQLIGRVGSTGRATGPHLHYEVRLSGKSMNPMRFLSPG